VADNSKQQNGGKEQMPSDCRPIKALDPHTRKEWNLFVRVRKIRQTASKGMGAASELACTVLETVQKPKAVFRGVTECDDGDETWLCYVGAPARAFDYRTGNARPAWKGEVFLVFVDEDLIVRRWEWTDADRDHPHLPDRHDRGRFRERLL
jgi:hypothetical protein